MLYAALQNGVDVKDRVQHAGPLRCRIHPPTYTHATRQKQNEAAQTTGAFMEQVM